MIFVAFLWILATKVISHNKEGKVPLYVYYLYKNLENQNNILIKNLKSIPEYKDKNVSEILNIISPKKYCEAFAQDMNLSGKVNCNGLSDQVETVEYNCIRSYNHKVNSNGTYTTTFSPSLENGKTINDYKNCTDIIGEKSFICKYKPENVSYNELVISNDDTQLYSCTTNANVNKFDIDGINSATLKNHFKTANNLYFNLYNTKIYKYKFALNATQDAICKANFANGGSGWDTLKSKIIIYDTTDTNNIKGYHISSCLDANNLWNDPSNENYNFSNKTNISCCGGTKNKNKLYLGLLTPYVYLNSKIIFSNNKYRERTARENSGYWYEQGTNVASHVFFLFYKTRK